MIPYILYICFLVVVFILLPIHYIYTNYDHIGLPGAIFYLAVNTTVWVIWVLFAKYISNAIFKEY